MRLGQAQQYAGQDWRFKLARGDHREAIAQLQQARGLSENSMLMTATLAAALGAAGKHDEANALKTRPLRNPLEHRRGVMN